MSLHGAIEVVNAIGLASFLVLLGAVVFSMLQRLYLYKTAGLPLPVILKRGLVLFAALSVLGGETAVLRILGIQFGQDSIERLLFIIQANIILIGAMSYYAKVELFDMDDPRKG